MALEELSVRNLGVIPALSLRFGSGMTALTGETGAGKTLLVEAIELLVGGRAESILVGPAGSEARIDGRFVTDSGDEVVLSRVVPAAGRSRAYVDGRPASVAELATLGSVLVDLHGQHAHQSLLAAAAQRAALDVFAGIDPSPLRDAAAAVRDLEAELERLGGDEASRARELEFCRFQLAEIEAAALSDPDEDDELAAEEGRLADAVAHQAAAQLAYDALTVDGGAGEGLASAIGALRDRPPFAALEERARGLAAELDDLAAELRSLAETLEPDPERLEAARARRQQLRDLARKYGVASGVPIAGAILAYADEVGARCDELERQEERAGAVQGDLDAARARHAEAAAAVGRARRTAAPGLGAATQAQLEALAMPRARLEVEVGDVDPGDDVTFLLAANPGAPLLPLAKVASGGELARSMLALRLALIGVGPRPEVAPPVPDPRHVPPTMIFDEVDAGIGGTAASAVGEALARLARGRQVFVVTHLPQVAAWADHQVAVAKAQESDTTVSEARHLEAEDRVVELARMLSGSPDSESAQAHARELLGEAVAARTGSA